MLEMPDGQEKVKHAEKEKLSDEGFMRHVDSGIKRLDDIERDLADVISVPT